MTVIHATERSEPKGRKPLEWKLITDLPVRSRRDAIEKLDWYAMRWKIETFHKILKSGCKAEESRLRSADRLANLISVFCILSWRCEDHVVVLDGQEISLTRLEPPARSASLAPWTMSVAT